MNKVVRNLGDIVPGTPLPGQTPRAGDTPGVFPWAYPSRHSINVGNKGGTPAAVAQAFTDALADVVAGGTIYLPTGTWDSTIVGVGTEFFPTFQVNKSNVRIVGDGDGSVLRLASGASTGAGILYVTADDVTIEGLTFDLATSDGTSAFGVQVRNTAERVRIQHVTFLPGSNSLCSVYLLGACRDVEIAHNRFRGPKFGVLVHESSTASKVRICDNDFAGDGVTAGDAIEVNTPLGGASNVIATGNLIRGYPTTGNNGIGIGYAHVTGGVISSNIVEDCGLDGIHVEDGSSGIVVSDNRVTGCGRSGIAVNSSDVYETRYTRDISVVGNLIEGCLTDDGTGGIAVEGNLATKGMTVTANVVRGCGRAAAECYGIDAQFASEDHRIFANIVSNTVGGTTAGIRLGESRNVLVQGNRCYDDQVDENELPAKTQDHGLVVSGDQTDVSIFDNDFTGNGTGAIDEAAIGVTTRYVKRNNGGDAPAAYTVANGTTDRAFDADTVAVAELADVVGTLIADLRGRGMVG